MTYFSQRTLWPEAETDGSSACPFDLTETNPTRVGLVEPERMAALIKGVVAYDPSSFGAPSARLAVQDYYRRRGHALDAERVVLSASTSEAYSWLFKLLADPGDVLLVPEPSYPLFDCLAKLEGVRLAPYALRKEDHFRLDVPELFRRVADETAVRGIIVVAPNNPTGTVLHEEDAALLEQGARERALPLIVDEVFADYLDVPAAMRARLRTSFASSNTTLTFVMSGLSKVACCPGAKLAWTIVNGPEPWRTVALERLGVVADTFLSVGSPVQAALPQLLVQSDAVHVELNARLSLNRASLNRACEQTHGAVRVLPSHGGWSAILELPRVVTEAEWQARFSAVGVKVSSGALFDIPGGRSLVLSLIVEPALFREAMQRMVDAILPLLT